jgi:hypothetical protein
MNLLILQSLPASITHSFSGPNIPLSNLNLWSALSVRDQVSCPYKPTDERVVLQILAAKKSVTQTEKVIKCKVKVNLSLC